MVQTVTGAHDKLKEALEFLEKEEKAMEDGWEERKHAMIDLYEARVLRAQQQVVKATKDFIYYLKEAEIKF